MHMICTLAACPSLFLSFLAVHEVLVRSPSGSCSSKHRVQQTAGLGVGSHTAAASRRIVVRPTSLPPHTSVCGLRCSLMGMPLHMTSDMTCECPRGSSVGGEAAAAGRRKPCGRWRGLLQAAATAAACCNMRLSKRQQQGCTQATCRTWTCVPRSGGRQG